MNNIYHKRVYAVITKHCNLNCPHCFIRNDEDDGWNQELFLHQLREFDGEVILFGGEPTYHRERLSAIVTDQDIFNKVSTISTNLINLDDELIELYKKIGWIGTSWNRARFSSSEYSTWLQNIDRLENRDINVGLLITLTPDLIEMNPSDFVSIVKEWNFNVQYL